MQVPSSGLQTFDQTRDFLFGLRNTGMKYGIERMRALAAALGHPERSYPVIHVAGTNGKGSTCASIESIYRKAGYRTGMYTSPHLVRLNERIQVDRVSIQDEQVLEMTRHIADIGAELERQEEGMFPSFFEFMTAMAFLHFKAKAVDVAIIEVGLGGRLDATNVVQPAVTAITSIGLDHTHILGNTVEQIASEKAGIIKQGIPVILGEIAPSPKQVILDIAKQQSAPVYDSAAKDHDLPLSGLAGHFQKLNAATAQKCVEVLERKLPISEQSIRDGLEGVRWAGRWERLVLASGHELILDTTHNEAGVAGLWENLTKLRTEFGGNARFPVIAGVLGRDRAASILPVLREFASELIWLEPDQPRASEWDSISDLWEENIPAMERKIQEIFPMPSSVNLALSDRPCIVTGSIYLIGEVKTRLDGERDYDDSALQDDVRSKA